MIKKNKKIFCTLGPSSINPKFLKFISKKKDVSLVRLNMSHIKLNDLNKIIKYVKKFTNKSICIDTEGAQIRTNVKKSFFYKVGSIFKTHKKTGNFKIYPKCF